MLARRRILGGSLLALWLPIAWTRPAEARVLPPDGCVVVKGWVLKRGDLDLLR